MSSAILRRVPIFDTNIFGHVQDGTIGQRDWRHLLRHRPRHGWPISAVTALELLAGFHEKSSERFLEQKAQVELACQLSKGRILEEPRLLICRDVLHACFPPDEVPLPVDVIADHITIVRFAKSMDDIVAGRVLVNRLQTRGHGRRGLSGFQPAIIKELIAGPKAMWKQRLETTASENYPSWREHFKETGRRLPDELRKDLETRLDSDVERMGFGRTIIQWLGGSTESASVAEFAKRIDAALEFTVYVLREFLLRQYKIEKHDSDVYDQFQLHYLALDKFVIVSQDSDLTKRTSRSSQADRILSFDDFLQTL